MSRRSEIRLFGHIFEHNGDRVSLELSPSGEFADDGLWLNCMVFTHGDTFGTEAFFNHEALRIIDRAYRDSLSSGAIDYALHDTDHVFDLELNYDSKARNYSCSLALNFEWREERPLISLKVEELRVELDVVQRFVTQLSELL